MYWPSEPLKQHERSISLSRVTQNKEKHGFSISWNTALTFYDLKSATGVLFAVQTCLANGYSSSARISVWTTHGTVLTAPFPSHPTAFFSKVLIRNSYQDEGNCGVGKNTKKPQLIPWGEKEGHKMTLSTWGYLLLLFLLLPVCSSLLSPFSSL